jgi:hypothetical protein
VLLGSGLSAAGKRQLAAVAEASGAAVARGWGPQVTHVVCGTAEGVARWERFHPWMWTEAVKPRCACYVSRACGAPYCLPSRIPPRARHADQKMLGMPCPVVDACTSPWRVVGLACVAQPL